MAETINTFQEGLLMDAHPLTTPQDCLTNALNATLITYNGNEFVLQNDMGNGRVETAFLPSGYVPVGVKEYGGIIYVASYNPIKNQSQIGCFPSPERLISSDEVNVSNVELTDDVFGLTNKTNPNNDYKTYGASTEYIKLELFEASKIFNPGDQFMISLKQGDLNKDDGNKILEKIISYYGEFIKTQNITIHLAVLDDVGNVTFIEQDLLKDPTSKYWMPYYNSSVITNNQDPDQFRDSIGDSNKYNIFKNKTSGKLVLIVELEGMDDFDFSRSVDIIKTGQVSDLDPSNPNDLISNYDTFGVNFRGTSNKYTEKNSANFKGYKIEYWLYDENDTIILNDTIYRTDLDTNKYNLGEKIQFELNLKYKEIEEGFLRNHKLKYKVIPFTDFMFLERLKKSGIIDFSKINSGIHELTEWRYFNSNSTLLSYGFDYNPLEGHQIEEVYFEFFDVSGGFSVYYPCKLRDNWSGNFTDTIQFLNNEIPEYGIYNSSENKIQLSKSKKYQINSSKLKNNNFYLVRICIKEKYTEEIVKYKETNYYRYLYTTSIFNSHYIDDFETIQDFSKLDINPSIEIMTTGSNFDGIEVLQKDQDTGNFFDLNTNNRNKLLTSNRETILNISFSSTLKNYLHNENKYFGNFNEDVLDVTWKNELPTSEIKSLVINDNINFPSGYFDEAIDELKKEHALNKTYDHSKTLNSKTYIYSNKISLNRSITAIPKSELIKYEAKKLERYYKPEWLSDPEKYINEINQRIYGVRVERGRLTFNKGVYFTRGDMYTAGISPNGNVTTESRYSGTTSAEFKQGMRKISKNTGNQTTFALIQNGNYQPYHRDSGWRWSYPGTEIRTSKKRFPYGSMMIMWRAYPQSADMTDGDYGIINMVSKGGWLGGVEYSDGFQGTHRKSGLTMAQALAIILSKLFLVQFKNFETNVLIPNNIAYYNSYDNDIIYKIQYHLNNTLKGSIFTFNSILGKINFYNDINSTGGLFTYLEKLILPEILEKFKKEFQNNLPINDMSSINLINPSNEVIRKFTFGKSIDINSLLQKYRNPENYISTSLTSDEIQDEEGFKVDGNGKKYDINTVYVGYTSPPNSSTIITRLYPVDKHLYSKGTVIREINNDKAFKILGGNDLLRTSYRAYGAELGVLNQPLVNFAQSTDMEMEWEVSGGGNPRNVERIRRDILFADSFMGLSADDQFFNRHGNSKNH